MTPVRNSHARQRIRFASHDVGNASACRCSVWPREAAARITPSMLPSPQMRTVTTVGLPARKEQLIKSMLLAVTARTTDRWAFADGLEADVAICDVDSTLATVAVARAQREGRPHCVWLVSGDDPAPDGRRLDDPIGSSSLIALLDDVSSAMRPADVQLPPAAAMAPTVESKADQAAATGRTALDAAVMLRDLFAA